MAEHHRQVRARLARFRGREIDTAGDGFFAHELKGIPGEWRLYAVTSS